jgi:glycosyltransferase involved in cell wall biosynthesis
VHGYFSAGDLAAVKELAAQLGLENDTTWFNQIPMPEVFRLYRSSLLCVLPFMESFAGLAVATAAAVGLPVIATKNAGIREHAGEDGIWIDNDDPEEIVAQIERLLGSEELRSDLSRRLRKRAEQCLSWDVVADKTLAVYERALRRKMNEDFYSVAHRRSIKQLFNSCTCHRGCGGPGRA